mmetsp:Transcript_65376/g.129406  ORF Transcript_65376/g.129406 Transcript_65376/m.129406 type:complete len:83 (-) Transcript_65376:1025-1273(-)
MPSTSSALKEAGHAPNTPHTFMSQNPLDHGGCRACVRAWTSQRLNLTRTPCDIHTREDVGLAIESMRTAARSVEKASALYQG